MGSHNFKSQIPSHLVVQIRWDLRFRPFWFAKGLRRVIQDEIMISSYQPWMSSRLDYPEVYMPWCGTTVAWSANSAHAQQEPYLPGHRPWVKSNQRQTVSKVHLSNIGAMNVSDHVTFHPWLDREISMLNRWMGHRKGLPDSLAPIETFEILETRSTWQYSWVRQNPISIRTYILTKHLLKSRILLAHVSQVLRRFLFVVSIFRSHVSTG